jgi:iron uptake system EfeUOB component EfeO/EfeM
MAGGPAGAQATQQQNTAHQMLAETEQNLKKIAGRTLTANQQYMVSQVRQFMQQSKAATAAGDLDRARTLAWKAQLLSEELANPRK